MIEEAVSIFETRPNQQPIVEINATDPATLLPLVDDIVEINCGEGRVILRGSNSSDGDNGAQGLTFKWELIEGDPTGVILPEENLEFMDIEVAFVKEGLYTIQLTIDDGQAERNIDVGDVELDAVDGLGPNEPPVVTVVTNPDPAVAGLTAGEATIDFATAADTGDDGCIQTLTYLWEKLEGPR